MNWELTRTIPGYYDQDELFRLDELCKRALRSVKQDRFWIVEVGVEYGRSMSVLLDATDEMARHSGVWTCLVLVDARVHNADVGHESTTKVLSDFRTQQTPPLRSISIWRMDSPFAGERVYSAEAAETLRNNQTDVQVSFLHIDVDHTSTGVIADLAAWTPLIAEDGIMVLHDYDRRGPASEGSQPVFRDYTEAIDRWKAFNADERTNVINGRAAEWECLGVVNTQIAFRKKRKEEIGE